MPFPLAARGLAVFAYISLLCSPQQAEAITLPSSYDTVWTTQSQNSAGSMPVGGGDIGLNAWAENGEILFYMAKSGTFDENNSILKLGRVRISLDPNPFATNAKIFEQRLLINDGYATFKGDNNTLVKLWVDVYTSAIHVDITSSLTMNLTASYETWRVHGYDMTHNEQQQTSWGVNESPKIPLPHQYPDTTKFTAEDGVLSYHHNTLQPLIDFDVSNQKLSSIADELYNPMENNTFGIFMNSPQLTPGTTKTGKYQNTNYTAYPLVSKTVGNSFNIHIATAQNQTIDTMAWEAALISQASNIAEATQIASLDWWHSYWDRSYIIINPTAAASDAGFQVGKNYQYWRYMMGCNAMSSWPMRFNGGLFTFDPKLVDSSYTFTPDYRKWSGGTFTAQNQRLLYWPLLKSGDFDLMKQQFDYYKRITPNNRLLGKLYFGMDVCVFSEQIDNTGLPNAYEYDAMWFDGQPDRSTSPLLYPAGIDYNHWLSWLQDTANEFADMILQANIYDGFDVTPYLPFIEHQLAWFDEFYRKRNGLDTNGKLIIYPASGAETYKLSLNPTSTVSGIRKLITDLLTVNPAYVKGNTSYYQDYYNRVPDTLTRPCPGAASLTCITPASNWSYTGNSEPTALYTVFPWGEYGLGASTNLSWAINTYLNDSSSASWHDTVGWRQDQIWLARMGLTSLATPITQSRLSDSTTYRFPTFKGPNYDWSPDMNHYGSAAIGLQEQLMQTFVGDQIRLLPAWPTEWTGYFKLLAPNKTTVWANITGGTTVSNLVVSPASRASDVVYGSSS